jgi:DNA-binding LacI/PurR family transcriptional regulator
MTTIYDVAKAAGVTATTVSNVLSGKGSVGAVTRVRVLKYVQELGYQPNLVARSLIKGRTGLLGLVVPALDNPYFAELAVEAESAAFEAGLRIFLTSLTRRDERTSQKLLKDLLLRRVDGILITPGALTSQEILSLPTPHPPIVHCGREGHKREIIPSVTVDFSQGGQLAAEHLLALGHRRIGIIPHVEGGERHLRVTSFQETLQRANCPPALVQDARSTPESGRAAGYALLTQNPRPSAIFVANDVTAFGVMAIAWELGLRIPQDLSIISMDDVTLAAYTPPPLTTVRIDRKILMEKALELLLSLIEGQTVLTYPCIPTTLMVRASTAPPAEEREVMQKGERDLIVLEKETVVTEGFPTF